MKTVVVIGIGKENYNYKKIKGFIDGFNLLGYKTFHYRQLNREVLKKHEKINILFAETDFLEGKFENVENFVLWTNTKFSTVIKFAENNKHVKIIFSPKSFMFNEEVNEKYNQLFFTSDYQMVDHEGQNLEIISEIAAKKQKIDTCSYKVFDNLIFSYMPCTKSEIIDPNTLKESKYKFSYFGTGYNRPRILEIVKFLKTNHPSLINAHFVEHGGPIEPEACISFYKESEYVLHEQINPVILEYAVRIGEASAAGAKIILIEDLPLYENIKPMNKVPEMIKIDSVESFVDNLKSIPDRSIEERKKYSSEFIHTYESAIKEYKFLFSKFSTNINCDI